jgi:hypothetical protein
MSDSSEIDIAKTIKQIDGLKVELLENVAALFRGFLRGSESVLIECVANILVVAYLLANKLGFSFAEVDREALEILRRKSKTALDQETFQSEVGLLEEHLNVNR